MGGSYRTRSVVARLRASRDFCSLCLTSAQATHTHKRTIAGNSTGLSEVRAHASTPQSIREDRTGRSRGSYLARVHCTHPCLNPRVHRINPKPLRASHPWVNCENPKILTRYEHSFQVLWVARTCAPTSGRLALERLQKICVLDEIFCALGYPAPVVYLDHGPSLVFVQDQTASSKQILSNHTASRRRAKTATLSSCQAPRGTRRARSTTPACAGTHHLVLLPEDRFDQGSRRAGSGSRSLEPRSGARSSCVPFLLPTNNSIFLIFFCVTVPVVKHKS